MASLSFKAVTGLILKFLEYKGILLLSLMALIVFLSVSNTMYKELGIIISFVLILFHLKLNSEKTFLDHPTIHYLGEISYGIYILHPLVSYPVRFIILLFFGSKQPFNEEAFTFIYFMILFCSTILTAHLSYKHFESNFIKEKANRVK
jgi:peptidoglycan/LPS O-acetylase OafA/YrhL